MAIDIALGAALHQIQVEERTFRTDVHVAVPVPAPDEFIAVGGVREGSGQVLALVGLLVGVRPNYIVVVFKKQ